MDELVEVFRRWQAGESPRRIAKALGLVRNTVRSYLRAAEGAGIGRERVLSPEEWAVFVREHFPAIESGAARAVWWAELEQRRDEIVQALAQNRVTTVWQRMHGDGKVGCSLSTFRRYVRAQIPEAVDPARVVIHGVAAEAGELAEVDYGRLGPVVDPATGRERVLWAFIMVLVFSRHIFVRPVFTMEQETWLECHLRAFSFFEGSVRRVVLDNLRTGVLKPSIYDPTLNRAYAEMGRHYDLLLDPARSGRPTDKPVVERNVQFVREHMFRGREERFPDLATGAAWAAQWCREEAGTRTHRTTGRRPWDLFMEVERPALRPLPTEAWEICTWERVTVRRDSSCLVAGATYSVPWRLLEQPLDVRVTGRRVEFFRETELVKTHPRVPRGRRQLDDSDLPQERIAFFRRTPPWCLEQAGTLGPDVLAAVRELLEVRTNSRLRQAQRVLELAGTFGPARLNAACARACAYGDPRYLTVKNILVSGLDQRPGALPLWPLERPTQAGAFLRGPEAFGAGSAVAPVSPDLPGVTQTAGHEGTTRGGAALAEPVAVLRRLPRDPRRVRPGPLTSDGIALVPSRS